MDLTPTPAGSTNTSPRSSRTLITPAAATVLLALGPLRCLLMCQVDLGILSVHPVQSHKALHSEGSTLDLMFCFCHLEILNFFKHIIPCFYFAKDSDYYAFTLVVRECSTHVLLITLLILKILSCLQSLWLTSFYRSRH